MNVYKRCTQSIKKRCWKWTMIAKKLKMKKQKTTNRQWIWWSINKEQVEVAMRQLIQYEAADACMCGWTWKGDKNGWGSIWGKQCDCEYKAWSSGLQNGWYENACLLSILVSVILKGFDIKGSYTFFSPFKTVLTNFMFYPETMP